MYFKSKNGIAINVDASTKNIYLKKYIWSPAKCSYKKWEIIRKCFESLAVQWLYVMKLQMKKPSRTMKKQKLFQ